MDIKDVEREEESIKAQDTRREGAEGFAAADILGELFNNDEGIDAVADTEDTSADSMVGEGDESYDAMPCVTSDDNAAAPTCESAYESPVDGESTNANAADESAETTDAASDEIAEVIDPEIEYDPSPSGDEGDGEDGQIAIDLGDGTKGAIIDVGSDDPIAGENGDGMADEKPREQSEGDESNDTDTSGEAIPSPSDISEGDSATEEKEPHAFDDEFERERFYQEAQDHEHTERITPTPALKLTEAIPGGEDSTEQLSIFDIKAQAGEPKGKTLLGNIFDFLELFTFTLAVVVLLLSFFFRHSVVDGDSMLGTLHNGEHLIISDLFYTPSRGDIVVFEDHSTGFKKPLIKRIIGVGGDEIRISGKKVYLNGELLEEDYVYVDGYYSDASIVLVVPEGELFVMGDHRNESSDSRIFGTISEDTVIGHVILRFYPFDTFGAVD